MSGLSPTELRNSVRSIVGLDTSDLSNGACDVFLNRALWWLQNLIDLPENEQIVTVPTVASQVEYALTYPASGILAISLHDPDSDELVILDVIGGYANDDITSFAAEDEGKPTAFERFGNSFYLRPVPDAVYDLQVRRKETIADITSATTTISLDPALHEVLIYGGAERVFLDYRDFNSSDRMKKEWGVKLQGYRPQKVIEQGNWKYAQVKVIRPPY